MLFKLLKVFTITGVSHLRVDNLLSGISLEGHGMSIIAKELVAYNGPVGMGYKKSTVINRLVECTSILPHLQVSGSFAGEGSFVVGSVGPIKRFHYYFNLLQTGVEAIWGSPRP